MFRYKFNQFISRLYFPKKELTGKVWDMDEHRSWGNNIQWSNIPDLKLVGWTTPRIKIGDEVLSETQSGKTMRYAVIDTEHAHGVDDMWWAHVEQLGYLNEPLMNHKYREAK